MFAKSIHHVSFAVRDLDASRAFYESVLGLEPVERPDLGLPGVWYGAGNAQIHLIAAPEGFDVGEPAAKLTPLANHCAFAIESYDDARAFLKTRGAEIFETQPEIGQLWLRDPDGNVIELIDPRGRGAGNS